MVFKNIRCRIQLTAHSWESAYKREINNYQKDIDDEGTIWFSEINAEGKVMQLLKAFEQRSLIQPGCRFLDLGTGNGHMLFALREEDDEGQCWDGEMVGVDYSESSVLLARRIASQHSEAMNGTDSNVDMDGDQDHSDSATAERDEQSAPKIQFELWDILSQRPGNWLKGGFDVVLDKGTFDAISLMHLVEGTSHPCQIYREKVAELVKPGCFLFVTSCNWTKDELVGWLAVEGGELNYFDEGKYPKFTFGGRTGQSVVTAVFRRREYSTAIGGHRSTAEQR